MKVTPRFTIRAALVLAAVGAIGAFGACKKDAVAPPPPPVSPPPPPPLAAPSALTATAGTGTRIDLAWTDNSTTETGFRVERCAGAGCTNYAQIGANTAADITAFADEFGLAVGTSYSYRVQAFNATETSAFSSTATAITGSPPPAGQVMIGAGEITTCSGSIGTSQTATLIQNQRTADPNTIVFTLGNNVGGPVDGNYTSCGFDASWGRFGKDGGVMKVAVGDGDFDVAGESGVWSYFGGPLAPNGWYSFDVGSNWHVVVLNTNTWQQSVCNITHTPLGGTDCTGKPAPQLDWLAADLAANTKPCLMAISWERRLYTSTPGTMGRNGNMNEIAQMLYAAGADILLSANQKQYMRFPKSTEDGVPSATGFAQFVVGTGGRSLDAMHPPADGNPVAAQFGARKNPDGSPIPDSWGVVKFTLNASSYKWEWIGTNPAAFSDSGEQACN